jgi:hypothetical protein
MEKNLYHLCKVFHTTRFAVKDGEDKINELKAEILRTEEKIANDEFLLGIIQDELKKHPYEAEFIDQFITKK